MGVAVGEGSAAILQGACAGANVIVFGMVLPGAAAHGVVHAVQRVADSVLDIVQRVLHGLVRDLAGRVSPAVMPAVAPADVQRLAEGMQRAAVPRRVDRSAHGVPGGEQDAAHDQHDDG